MISSITNTSYSEDSVYLTKDSKVPFDGYLLPQEKIVEFRNNKIDLEFNKSLNESLNKSLKLQDAKVKLLMDQNTKLYDSVVSSEHISTLEKIGIFVLGVVIMGSAVKLSHEAQK